jgi:hypothetical protein
MVKRLAMIWKEQTGSSPTRTTNPDGSRSGAFVDFCRSVMVPIYQSVTGPDGQHHRLEPPSIGSIVNTVLRELDKKSAE